MTLIQFTSNRAIVMECERIQRHSIASIAVDLRRKWFEPEKTIFDLKQCFGLVFFCFSPDVFDIQLSSFEERFFGEHFERLPTSMCQPAFFWHPAKPIAFLSLSLSPKLLRVAVISNWQPSAIHLSKSTGDACLFLLWFQIIFMAKLILTWNETLSLYEKNKQI